MYSIRMIYSLCCMILIHLYLLEDFCALQSVTSYKLTKIVVSFTFYHWFLVKYFLKSRWYLQNIPVFCDNIRYTWQISIVNYRHWNAILYCSFISLLVSFHILRFICLFIYQILWVPSFFESFCNDVTVFVEFRGNWTYTFYA